MNIFKGSEINVRILSVARSSELREITGLLAMPKMIANRWVKSRKPPACFWNYSKLSISIFSIYRALAQPRICLSRYQSLRTISLLYEVVRVEGMKTCQKKQNKTKQNKTIEQNQNKKKKRTCLPLLNQKMQNQGPMNKFQIKTNLKRGRFGHGP